MKLVYIRTFLSPCKSIGEFDSGKLRELSLKPAWGRDARLRLESRMDIVASFPVTESNANLIARLFENCSPSAVISNWSSKPNWIRVTLRSELEIDDFLVEIYQSLPQWPNNLVKMLLERVTNEFKREG